jgi:hypothetical protein
VTGSTSISGSQNYLTDVGAYSSSYSYYGTFDQGGNVYEWNEALITVNRGIRGSAWSIGGTGGLTASDRNSAPTALEVQYIGFRVASVASIPEPGDLGDYNQDGFVDAADYVVWRKNETANAPLPNDNGLATQAERFDLWKTNFGSMAMTGAGGETGDAVPEPTTWTLLSIAAICLRSLRPTRLLWNVHPPRRTTWLSSARVVRRRVRSLNEQNPCRPLLSMKPGFNFGACSTASGSCS